MRGSKPGVSTAAKLSHEKSGQTLQVTALLHNAYVRLLGPGNLLKFLPARGTAFLRLIVCLAASVACLALNLRQARAVDGYEVPNAAYDAPAGYYNTATGTGTTLRTNLHNIITSGYTGNNYGDSRSILPVLWQDPTNSNNMILTYNNASVVKPTGGTIPGWDEGTTWNREHLWPQSLLGISVSNSYIGAGSDLFELAPCNPSVNSSRGNNDYGTSDASGTYFNHGIGPSYFFPGDAQKGDVAHSIFYMATRYYDGSSTASINNLNIVDGFPNDTSITTHNIGDRQALLRWNYADGVNNFERRRNDLIYDTYQHNRNPFIDHPEYVWAVFGDALNNSQISVATPAGDGSSSTTANLGNVIVGTAFGTANVTVGKTGNTPTTFDVTTSGNAVTSGSGLQSGTGHPFNYGSQSSSMTVGWTGSTATAGAKSGTVTINNTDLTTAGTGQGSADGDDVVTVTGNVLDHANASFATPSDTNSTTVNVGIYKTGTGTQTAGFNINNLVNTASYTAGLQYVSQSGSGNTGQLSSNIATAFTSVLAAGSSIGLQANLSTASAGSFSAAYTLTLGDDASVTGHTNQNVTLNLSGKVRNNGTIYWTAAGDSAWDLSHTKTNWVDPTNPDVYLQSDTVVFNDAQNPSGSRAVTLNTSVTPAAVTVDHSTGSDYTISGSGNIGGSTALTKTGSGKLTLSTNNTYIGATTVAAGTLRVEGTHTGGDRYTVSSGATLGGGGSITAPVTVDAGAFLDPALGGALGVGSATLNGTLDISIDESIAGVVSVLDDADVLNISSGTSRIDFNVTGLLTQPAYVFATYGSLIGSSFANVSDLPSGYTIAYSYQGQQEMALVAVPEPSTLMLAALGVAGVAAFPPRRRK